MSGPRTCGPRFWRCSRPPPFPSRLAAGVATAATHRAEEAAAVAADVVINIVAENGNMSFTPNPATVTRGQTVAWRNSAAAVHTATQNSGAFNTGNINSGNTSGAITMSTAGAFDYHCALHPAMVGTLNVQ